jgi:hypothetical protein
MSITIWPHDWNFSTFLLGVAVFMTGAIVGCWTGAYMFTDGYRTGWGDAKAVYGPHAQHSHPNQAGTQPHQMKP